MYNILYLYQLSDVCNMLFESPILYNSTHLRHNIKSLSKDH